MRDEAEDAPTEFSIRIDSGDPQPFTSRHSQYALAVMEAFGKLGLPYPCTIEIWVPGLVDAGYGPYSYYIGYFNAQGNEYGAPAVMTVHSVRPGG